MSPVTISVFVSIKDSPVHITFSVFKGKKQYLYKMRGPSHAGLPPAQVQLVTLLVTPPALPKDLEVTKGKLSTRYQSLGSVWTGFLAWGPSSPSQPAKSVCDRTSKAIALKLDRSVLQHPLYSTHQTHVFTGARHCKKMGSKSNHLLHLHRNPPTFHF